MDRTHRQELPVSPREQVLDDITRELDGLPATVGLGPVLNAQEQPLESIQEGIEMLLPPFQS
jgi:hypothetical protein